MIDRKTLHTVLRPSGSYSKGSGGGGLGPIYAPAPFLSPRPKPYCRRMFLNHTLRWRLHGSEPAFLIGLVVFAEILASYEIP